MVKVTVYSTTWCPWCHRAEDFLKKNKVAYTVKNIEEDEEAMKEMVEKTGQTGVPVIDIDGTAITGFDEAAIRKALKL